jgi:hypothetical protein
MSTYPELDNLEIERLKKRVSELEIELAKARSILEENDLADELPTISDAEAICINEIHKLRVASDNGILTLEDVKVLDILVKCTLSLKNKQPITESKSIKKGKKSVAELLSIVDKATK